MGLLTPQGALICGADSHSARQAVRRHLWHPYVRERVPLAPYSEPQEPVCTLPHYFFKI